MLVNRRVTGGKFDVLGFFKKSSPKPKAAYDGPPLDPEWRRNRRGKFHRLMHLDTVAEGLQGQAGIFVIWHSGVKPQWVYVGRANDLAGAIDAVQDDEDTMSYEINGGLYVTWSPIIKSSQAGVLKFLHDTMRPQVPNPEASSIKDGPINVKLPSRREG